MQKNIEFLIYILLHTFIDRNNQLIRLILRQLPLRINYWLHTCMNELLFEHILLIFKFGIFLNQRTRKSHESTSGGFR